MTNWILDGELKTWLKIQLEFHRRKKSPKSYEMQRLWKIFKPQTSEDKSLGEISHWL